MNLKNITLICILVSVNFFTSEYIGHMIYPCELGFQKANVEAISHDP